MKTITTARQMLRPALAIALAGITALADTAQAQSQSPDNQRNRPSSGSQGRPPSGPQGRPPPGVQVRPPPRPPGRPPPVMRPPRPIPGRPHFTEVRFGHDVFFTHRGVFYRQSPRGFVVVRPPVGMIVTTLPFGFTRIYINNIPHFRFNNVYYRAVPGGFMVVDRPSMIVNTPPPVIVNTPPPVIVHTPPPVIVNTPPPVVVNAPSPPPAPAPAETTATTTTAATATAVAPDENDFQTLWIDGTAFYFKNGQFFQNTEDGLVWVQPFASAVVQELPRDATSVWYQDIEYFDCDDVCYRKTPDGYEVVDAPWAADAQN